jgi:hypothetical protein
MGVVGYIQTAAIGAITQFREAQDGFWGDGMIGSKIEDLNRQDAKFAKRRKRTGERSLSRILEPFFEISR